MKPGYIVLIVINR